MVKIELKDFYNDGFGWICRQCEHEMRDQKVAGEPIGRLMKEGEAESKNPGLSLRALAKWADPEQRMLSCPRCGLTELADKH